MAEGLTDKQRAFIDFYFVCGFNATEAARRAGYAHPNKQGPALLVNLGIRAEISRRFAEIAMPADEVLARIGEVARADMGDFLRVDEEEVTLNWSLIDIPLTDEGEPDVGGVTLSLAMQENVKPTDKILMTQTVKRAVARLDLLAAGEAGKLHLIKKYAIDEKGKVSIELHDALAARNTIAKHHGLLLDRTEHTGTIGYTVDIGADTTDPDTAPPTGE